MSLPSATTVSSMSAINMNPQQLQAMEAPLMALANSAGGDLRKLLYAFFSFLHRRTDFYLVPHQDDLTEGKAKMGFPEGDAEKLLLAAFRQFPLRRIPQQHQQAGQSTKTAPTTSKAVPKPSVTAAKTTDVSATKPVAKDKTTTEAAAKDKTTTSKDTTKKETDGEIRYTEEGLQEPVGNGGSTKRYKWTQTIDECTVLVAVGEGTRAKDLDVALKASSLHVKTKAKNKDGDVTTFVDGSLLEKINPEESTWSLEGGVLIVLLYKVQKKFWDTIIEGDERIDTSLVDSRRKIDEYDEATQGQLRKIIFDQNQMDKGLPTSDEIMGTKTVPPLPAGVEYIDGKLLDEKVPPTNNKGAANSGGGGGAPK